MAESQRTAASDHDKSFTGALDIARHVLRRRFRVARLVRAAYQHARENESGIKRVRSDLLTLIRMASAWAHRKYTVIPWKAILYVVGALVYFINPIDLIPDFIAGIGFLDDAAVIAAVVRALQKEIEAFHSWEDEHPDGSDS